MRRSRFSEAQIIGILREQESGAATAELCRRHGVSQAAFYPTLLGMSKIVSEDERGSRLEDR